MLFLMVTLLSSPYTKQSLGIIYLIIWLPSLLFAQLNVTITPTNISCNGAADGQAKANPTGGVPPYTYAWSNNGTTQTIQNQSPGTYVVTVSDASQNTKTASAIITQPTILDLTIFTISAICDVAPDGSAACVPFGGTPLYTYLWSTGGTTPQIGNLSGGAYTVTVTDAHGCTSVDSAVVNAWHEGLWTIMSVNPTTCNFNQGTAQISILSGTSPFQYQWSNGGTTSDIENLAAGTYTVTASDVNGCSTTVAAIIIDQGLSLTSTSTFASCGYADGSAQVFALAGTPPYQYQWSNGANTQSIDSLAVGIYTVTVTDVGGCSGTEEALVPGDGSSPIAYLVSSPKCFNQTATFIGVPPPPKYPDKFWSLDKPTDQIISGQGTDTIQVHWGSTGHKLVTMRYGINGVFCGGSGFEFDVFICAAANEPELASTAVTPNPFSDFVQVEFPDGLPDDVEAILTDITGNMVLTQTLNKATDVLPTAQLPAGLYLLKIKTQHSQKVWKLTKP